MIQARTKGLYITLQYQWKGLGPYAAVAEPFKNSDILASETGSLGLTARICFSRTHRPVAQRLTLTSGHCQHQFATSPRPNSKDNRFQTACILITQPPSAIGSSSSAFSSPLFTSSTKHLLPLHSKLQRSSTRHPRFPSRKKPSDDFPLLLISRPRPPNPRGWISCRTLKPRWYNARAVLRGDRTRGTERTDGTERSKSQWTKGTTSISSER